MGIGVGRFLCLWDVGAEMGRSDDVRWVLGNGKKDGGKEGDFIGGKRWMGQQ